MKKIPILNDDRYMKRKITISRFLTTLLAEKMFFFIFFIYETNLSNFHENKILASFPLNQSLVDKINIIN